VSADAPPGAAAAAGATPSARATASLAATPAARDAAALVVEVEQRLPMRLSGSLRCAAGELLALVGPSGAGKTSMLRVMAGLLRPEQGRVVVGGEVWCDTSRGVFVPPQRRHVGLVFQSYALMPHLSALGNVALSLLHLAPAERLAQARHWLGHLGLTPAEQARRPAALSGGQQQRVAVARALAREPRLLLLDEPFSAVDQLNRQALHRLLADLRRELHIPIVLVTHDLNEARLLADRMAVMDAGCLLQTGTPAHIHDAPRNARVADLVGIQNRFRGVWLGPGPTAGQGRLRWTQGAVDEPAAPLLRVRDKGRLPPGQPVTWVVPGDAVTLLLDGEAPGRDDFEAEVVDARHLAEITLLTLAVAAAGGARFVLTVSGPRRRALAPGARLHLRLDAARVHVMPVRGH
jgi:molybdate transport system ATP-binding protein